MKGRPTTSRSTASAIVSMLDWLYHMGVNDACAGGDEGLCREYLDATSKPGVFGFVSQYPISWDEWCLRLMMQARRTAWNGQMSKFLQAAGRYQSNYLSVFYNVALLSYRKGVSDYIASPGGTNKQVFDGKKRVRWTARGCQNISVQEWVDEVQLQTFDLARRDAEIAAEIGDYESRKLGCLKELHYHYFRRAIGLVMVPR